MMNLFHPTPTPLLVSAWFSIPCLFDGILPYCPCTMFGAKILDGTVGAAQGHDDATERDAVMIKANVAGTLRLLEISSKGACCGGINYDGEVWPCCVLGYSKPMGWLRDAEYDFQRIWRSYQAQKVRTYIREGNCACPLANQAYSNILCSGKYVLKFLQTFLRYSLWA